MSPIHTILYLQGGYLIGSLSPAYLFGKVLKKVDIREVGTKNAGTMNTYKVLGFGPALFTALFDLSKGLLVMYLARLAGASPLVVHLAGVAAILGHVFPFYLHFRGGQGVATATAIMVYYLILFYAREWLPWESLLLLALCAFSFGYITRTGEIVGSVVLPTLGVCVLVFAPSGDFQVFILSMIGYILFINLLNIRNFQLLPLSTLREAKEINWRLYMRPLAVLLVIYLLSHPKMQTLTLIGSITLLFLALDLVRLFSSKINVFFFKTVKELYKSKEYRKFSSITLFLIASFLTVLLFDKPIAVLAVSFLIFGDFFSKFFGLQFGRTRIFNKTLEGSLAHLNACLIAGFIFLHYVSVPAPVFLAGALVATVSELLPLGVDDNFSVALLSASTMYAIQLF